MGVGVAVLMRVLAEAAWAASFGAGTDKRGPVLLLVQGGVRGLRPWLQRPVHCAAAGGQAGSGAP